MKLTLTVTKGNKMKAVNGFLASFGLIGVLAMVALWAFLFVSTIYGLYLAFSASIILGFISFFVQPSPLVFGLVMFLFDKNLPAMLMEFLNK